MARPPEWDVVIVGAGMAGLSAAIWARRLGLSAVVLEREGRPGGQLNLAGSRIFDYPGVDVPNGWAFTERLLRQVQEAGAELRLGQAVERIDGLRRACVTARGPVTGRAVVVATGLRPRRLEVPGEEELLRAGWVRRPSLDLEWFRGRRTVVIGGGDRAVENSLMLAPVARSVTLLHRGDRLRARREFQDALAREPRVDVRLNTRVEAFAPGGREVTVLAASPAGPLSLPADAVCIYIGSVPSSSLLAGQVDMDAEGYIITDRYGRTSLPGVYAVGDVCTPPPYQSLSTAGGQAMVAAKHISLFEM